MQNPVWALILTLSISSVKCFLKGKFSQLKKDKINKWAKQVRQKFLNPATG